MLGPYHGPALKKTTTPQHPRPPGAPLCQSARLRFAAPLAGAAGCGAASPLRGCACLRRLHPSHSAQAAGRAGLQEGLRRSWAALLALFALFPAGDVPAKTSEERSWYRSDYPVRRSVTLPRTAQRGDAVLLRFVTAGLTRPDGRDVRLVLEHRRSVPLDILRVGPGDTLLVRFAVYDPTLRLDVYFGSQTFVAPKQPPRQLKNGLLVELWKLPPGGCDTWAETKKLLSAANEQLGILTPDSIQLGLPPLGHRGSYLARYSGHLEVRESGLHAFETVSEGASFVLVDGKLIASWPGFHGLAGYRNPESRAEHSGTVRLKKGPHAIEYVVATRRGGVHLLGWAEPEDKTTRPISARHFRQWRWARAGVLENREGTRTADFEWRLTSDTNSDAEHHDLAEVAFRFHGNTGGRKAFRVRWNFGDGQEAEGQNAEHVYLKHGLYTVSAIATYPDGLVLKADRNVQVRFESTKRANLNALLEGYHGRTREYNLNTLPRSHLLQLVWLRGMDYRWEQDLWAAVDAWYGRGLPPTEGNLAELGLRRASRLAREGNQEPLARRILTSLSRRAPKDRLQRESRAWLAWLSARKENSPYGDAAVETLRELYEGGGVKDAARRAGLFLARCHLMKGRANDAETILRRLESEPGFRKYSGSREIAASNHWLSFDNLLRREEYIEAREELERWEWDLPADLLAGTLQIARARFFQARGRLADAVRELETLRTPPSARQQLPRGLLLEAEILRSQNKILEARRLLEKLVQEFPERPESREAADLLDRL